jgi:membrane fusion protein (multidrug efflux system)
MDPSTGTLMVEASFPNPGKVLRPGQFAKIKTVGQNLGSIVAVPRKAIRDLQGTKQIAVVTPANIIEVRTIKTSQEVGDIAVVAEGLTEGELVVPEVQQRLKSGMQVVPKIG